METTLIPTAGEAEPGLAAPFAAWARLPNLSAALSAPGAIHLVIEPGSGRILQAAPGARPLVDALAGPGLASLSRQIAAAAPSDGAPRLARLRLDLRRIAPPVLCWLARASRDDGDPVILVVPTVPVTPPRARPAPPEAAPTPEPQPVPQAPHATPGSTREAAPRRDDRFLWRLDAEGLLTTLTGPEPLQGLVGQRWQDLAATGRITGADGMLAALRERRTFRGEAATLDAGTGPFRVELSGAPVGRGEAAFSGFAGFGLIRGLPPALTETALGATAPVELAPADSAPAETAPTEPPPAEIAPVQAAPTETAPVQAAPDAIEPVAATADLAPGGTADPGLAPAALTTDEHAAFREIARALGARYAGDEAGPATATPKPESGAIMRFPGTQPSPPEAQGDVAPAPDPDMLAGLPLPALVHRGGAILAANDRLLDLTGHADLASLAGAGLGGLLPGFTASEEADPPARRTAVATAAGSARPVEALSGRCTWAGEAAACLIVRPLDEADAVGALTAERLARAAQAERAAGAEAALDALETGIVTLDGVGRIVAINRAAADMLGGDPREVVGGSFVALFDRESVLAVADLLRGDAKGSRPVSLAGNPVTLDVTARRDDGRRVALLDRAHRISPATPQVQEDHAAPAGGGSGTALTRLDRAFREPLTEMIALADAMLKEPFGALGDARYRGCLAEIKMSGETMLERVGKLLDLAAVEAGSLQLEPRPLDLNDVAASCVARLQAEAARGRIVVRTSFSADLGDLEADERSVSRAAQLVIEDAIRRSAAGGQIIVSTGAAERAGVALRVRDTGAGAAARAAAPAKDVEDGLALPRALVEANGGRLQLSARPEDGTLVEIIMPLRRAANG